MVQTPWMLPEPKEEKSEEKATCGYKEVVVKNTAGKTLFQQNCASCHAIQKVLNGPALADVEIRGPWKRRENLVRWIRNPAQMIETNPYAKTLSLEYNGQVMPSFTQLTNQQIHEIFDYIKEGSSLIQQNITAVP